MTCIVGIETKNSVIIGGDSASSGGYDITSTRLKKVFTRSLFLIGYTGSFRMGQILQYQLYVKEQTKKQTNLEYLSTTFIDAVRNCLTKGGYKKIENEVEEGGTFLVGYKNKLYLIDSDFQVNSSKDGFWACGCAASYALGNLYSTKELSPKQRIKQALKAATHFSSYVCKPYHIKEVKW